MAGTTTGTGTPGSKGGALNPPGTGGPAAPPGTGGPALPPPTPNIFQQSADNYTGGSNALAAGANRLGGVGSIGGGMGQYFNPFTEQVRNTTLTDIDRQRQLAINNGAGAAASAGAFGGSRHGVADSLTNEAAMRQMGQQSASLNQANFNTAAQLAGQDVSNQIGSGQALGQLGGMAGNMAQAGLGMGQSITGQQAQDGAMLRGLSEALIGQGAGMFDRYVNQPTDILQLRTAALGANPGSQTGTQTSQTSQSPGAMDMIGGLFKGIGMMGAK